MCCGLLPPKLIHVFSIIAMVLAIALLIKWVSNRRRGTGGGWRQLGPRLLFALVPGPELYFAKVLRVFDWIVNFLIHLFLAVVGS